MKSLIVISRCRDYVHGQGFRIGKEALAKLDCMVATILDDARALAETDGRITLKKRDVIEAADRWEEA